MCYDPKDSFPNMPDEVYDLWIKPHIECSGWPFSRNETMIPNTTWSKYLINHPLSFWRDVTWRLVSQAFVGVIIEKRAEDVASKLAEFGREFIETGFAKPTRVKNSPQKVAALASVLHTSGKFPKPLICLVKDGEWLLLDGHHRLAAMFMQNHFHNFPFETWLGTYNP